MPEVATSNGAGREGQRTPENDVCSRTEIFTLTTEEVNQFGTFELFPPCHVCRHLVVRCSIKQSTKGNFRNYLAFDNLYLMSAIFDLSHVTRNRRSDWIQSSQANVSGWVTADIKDTVCHFSQIFYWVFTFLKPDSPALSTLSSACGAYGPGVIATHHLQERMNAELAALIYPHDRDWVKNEIWAAEGCLIELQKVTDGCWAFIPVQTLTASVLTWHFWG